MSRESLPNFTSDPVGTVKDAASDLKDRATDMASTVADAAARQRTNAAKGLHTAASAIHDKAEKLGNAKASGAVHKVADGIDTTASYIEDNDFADMGEDVMNVARRHPGKAIITSLALGFLLGRALRR
jgi:hypothetical protein